MVDLIIFNNSNDGIAGFFNDIQSLLLQALYEKQLVEKSQ